jgi:hypothetical protein
MTTINTPMTFSPAAPPPPMLHLAFLFDDSYNGER